MKTRALIIARDPWWSDPPCGNCSLEKWAVTAVWLCMADLPGVIVKNDITHCAAEIKSDERMGTLARVQGHQIFRCDNMHYMNTLWLSRPMMWPRSTVLFWWVSAARTTLLFIRHTCVWVHVRPDSSALTRRVTARKAIFFRSFYCRPMSVVDCLPQIYSKQVKERGWLVT